VSAVIAVAITPRHSANTTGITTAATATGGEWCSCNATLNAPCREGHVHTRRDIMRREHSARRDRTIPPNCHDNRAIKLSRRLFVGLFNVSDVSSLLLLLLLLLVQLPHRFRKESRIAANTVAN